MNLGILSSLAQMTSGIGNAIREQELQIAKDEAQMKALAFQDEERAQKQVEWKRGGEDHKKKLEEWELRKRQVEQELARGEITKQEADERLVQVRREKAEWDAGADLRAKQKALQAAQVDVSKKDIAFAEEQRKVREANAKLELEQGDLTKRMALGDGIPVWGGRKIIELRNGTKIVYDPATRTPITDVSVEEYEAAAGVLPSFMKGDTKAEDLNPAQRRGLMNPAVFNALPSEERKKIITELGPEAGLSAKEYEALIDAKQKDIDAVAKSYNDRIKTLLSSVSSLGKVKETTAGFALDPEAPVSETTQVATLNAMIKELNDTKQLLNDTRMRDPVGEALTERSGKYRGKPKAVETPGPSLLGATGNLLTEDLPVVSAGAAPAVGNAEIPAGAPVKVPVVAPGAPAGAPVGAPVGAPGAGNRNEPTESYGEKFLRVNKEREAAAKAQFAEQERRRQEEDVFARDAETLMQIGADAPEQRRIFGDWRKKIGKEYGSWSGAIGSRRDSSVKELSDYTGIPMERIYKSPYLRKKLLDSLGVFSSEDL